MSNEELIKDYLKQIKDLQCEMWVKISVCSSMTEKLAIYDDYDNDIKVYKEEINKITE